MAEQPLYRRARSDAVAGVAVGLGAAGALPPFGWWPLGLAAMAGWWYLLEGRPPRRRALISWCVGLGQFGVGIVWFAEFSPPGWVLAVMGEAAFWAVAGAAAGADGSRWWRLPAALVLTDAARKLWPFGGIPLAGWELGQAAGPLAPTARLGGHLLVVAATALVGVGLGQAIVAGRGPRPETAAGPTAKLRAAVGAALAPAALAPAGLALLLAMSGLVAPSGRAVDTLRVAAVQGGGPRGYTEDETDALEVYERHLAATELIRGPVDLVVWPEDVIDATVVAGSHFDDRIGSIARRLNATVLAGATEDAGGIRFRNAVIAWSPDGRIIGRYDKVWRVPYGEYFPFRSLVSRLADIPGRDAVAGHGPGFIDTPAAPVGFGISYEGFFAERGRAAVNAGAQLYVIPTNAASFSGSIVPTQQLAAARIRSWETGRWIVQAGPTGFSAVMDDRGHLRARTDLSAQAVLEETVILRSGRTPYAVAGDRPTIVLAAAVLAAPWWGGRRRRRSRRT